MPNDKDPYERIFGKKKEVSKAPAPAPRINTGSYTPPDRKKADFKKWLRQDLWRIEEAIMLLLGLEPFDVKSDYWDKPQEYDDLYKLALSSQRIGTLKFHSAVDVQPSIFVEWALSKGIDVPEELATLAKKLDVSIASSEGNTEETTIKATIRCDENRAFLKARINEGLINFEEIWSHMRENAETKGYLFETVSNSKKIN